MTKVSELFVMPKDMPNKILLYKHLKTIEKYPNKLNERDIKMTNFKNLILSLEDSVISDNNTKNLFNSSNELEIIESELANIDPRFQIYYEKIKDFILKGQTPIINEQEKNVISKRKELITKRNKLVKLLDTNDRKKFYEDFIDSSKQIFYDTEDIVDSVLKGNAVSAALNALVLTEKLKSTKAMIETSKVSGFLKIVEGIGDGIGFAITGTISSYSLIIDGINYLDTKKTGEKHISLTKGIWEIAQDNIAIDNVKKLNDSFFNNTKAGENTNENSYLKYDSNGSLTIQTGAKFSGEVALSTLSGGILTPILFGTEALGESAQVEYQKEDRKIITARMGIETASGIFKGIMYNRIATNFIKLEQLGVEQSVSTVIKNAKASVSREGFEGILRHAFWSKDAGIDALFTAGQKGAEAYVEYDETGSVNWTNLALSTVTEFFTGRLSDTALGIASSDNWTYDTYRRKFSLFEKNKDIKSMFEFISNIPDSDKNYLSKGTIISRAEGFFEYDRDFDLIKTKYGKPVFEDINYVTFMTDKNILLTIPKICDMTKQKNLPSYVLSIYDEIIPEMKSSIKRILVRDISNPGDSFNAKKYNIPKFKSAASAGGGNISLWGIERKYSFSNLVNIMNHETAHNFEESYYNIAEKDISLTDLWINARKNDEIVSGKSSPTDYGLANPREDFAESIGLLSVLPEYIRRDFPNRYKILTEYLGLSVPTDSLYDLSMVEEGFFGEKILKTKTSDLKFMSDDAKGRKAKPVTEKNLDYINLKNTVAKNTMTTEDDCKYFNKMFQYGTTPEQQLINSTGKPMYKNFEFAIFNKYKLDQSKGTLKESATNINKKLDEFSKGIFEGGKIFRNEENTITGKLIPREGYTYWEYDVAAPSNNGRNRTRLLRCEETGEIWLTGDHYGTISKLWDNFRFNVDEIKKE